MIFTIRKPVAEVGLLKAWYILLLVAIATARDFSIFFSNLQFLKKLAAILLLSLLMFNWVGYQFYIAIMEMNADKAMISNIDKNNYAESDLVSIKVPVTYLYYYAGSTSFERIDGKVELEGVQYNYVKRRFFNDSLELLCLPNKTATHLRSAREEFFSLVNNVKNHGQSKNNTEQSAAFKSLTNVYPADAFLLSLPDQSALLQKGIDQFTFRIIKVHLSPGTQPPDIS